MRKQYIKPELEVFCFEAETLMSLSQPEDKKEDFWVDENGQGAAGSNKFEHGWSSSPWE
ncbi:MAG: hypothetical protein U0L77_06900 [Prevotellamassilia sp.]|nr:hypothetical protein [Prevotellamassilia sp.]